MNSYLIHSPLAHYANSAPDNPALTCNGQQMSYQELHASSNRLAQALIQIGVSAEDRIGIFMHKGLELGVAIYGILKAGCAFVPLDPFMPVERLAFIADDCDIQILISADAMAPALHELHQLTPSLHIVGVSQELPFTQSSWPDISHHDAVDPQLETIDQHLAYIMYTSGSTGEPKGMMHTLSLIHI